ncbi:hypothetical protein HDU93_005146 [Gonapodya sp. JEL0774]|nr:hypothetical protein HDU93_005146 [Gonapodya sp. JEL0774]
MDHTNSPPNVHVDIIEDHSTSKSSKSTPFDQPHHTTPPNASKKPVVLLDLSGTLHIDDSALPGAIEAVQKLRDNGYQIRFVSNTTKHSTSYLIRLLTDLGFTIYRHEVFTSLVAAKEVVRKKGGGRPLIFLEQEAREEFELEDCGERGVQGGDECGGGKGNAARNDGTVPASLSISESTSSVAPALISSTASLPYTAVVVGLAPSMFDYAHLTTAMNVLLEGGAFVAIHRGRYFARPGGLHLGPGPFVTLLESATGRQAVTVGKPSRSFFEMALASCGVAIPPTPAPVAELTPFTSTPSSPLLSPQNPPDLAPRIPAIMIGDDVRDDILGAGKLGITGLLVRTGKYRAGDENVKEEGVKVDCVRCFGSVVDAVEIHEGRGVAIYELGVSDDGTPAGLAPADLQATLDTLRQICAKSGAEVVQVTKRYVKDADLSKLSQHRSTVLPRPGGDYGLSRTTEDGLTRSEKKKKKRENFEQDMDARETRLREREDGFVSAMFDLEAMEGHVGGSKSSQLEDEKNPAPNASPGNTTLVPNVVHSIQFSYPERNSPSLKTSIKSTRARNAFVILGAAVEETAARTDSPGSTTRGSTKSSPHITDIASADMELASMFGPDVDSVQPSSYKKNSKEFGATSEDRRVVAEVVVRKVQNLGIDLFGGLERKHDAPMETTKPADSSSGGIRPAAVESFVEVRVIVLGPEHAGKSTLLGVLTHGVPDNSKGRARLNLLRHKHEVLTGRTSHLAHQLIGFPVAYSPGTDRPGTPGSLDGRRKMNPANDDDELSFFSHVTTSSMIPGDAISPSHSILNYRTHGTWEEIVGNSSRIVHFVDTAGHPKYRRTSVTGLMSYGPDAALLVVPSDKGYVGDVAKETWTMCNGLGVRAAIVVSKVDLASGINVRKTLEDIAEMVGGIFDWEADLPQFDDLKAQKRHRASDVDEPLHTTPERIKLALLKSPSSLSPRQMDSLVAGFVARNVVPVFLVSSVTEDGLDELVEFLRVLPKVNRFRWQEKVDSNVEFQIEEVFTVPGRQRDKIDISVAGLFGLSESDAEDSEDVGFEDSGDFETSPFVPERKVRTIRLRRGHAIVSTNVRSRIQIRIGESAATVPTPAGAWEVETQVEVLRPAQDSIRKSDESQRIARKGILHIGSIRQTVEISDVKDVIKSSVVRINVLEPTTPGVGVDIGDMEFPPVGLDDRSRSPSPLLQCDADLQPLPPPVDDAILQLSDGDPAPTVLKVDNTGALERLSEIGDRGFVRFRFLVKPEWVGSGWRVLYRADNGLLAPLDGADFERIRHESSGRSENPTQALTRERKEKHSKSLAMVEKWGDNLSQARARRLQAQEDRKLAIEIEREKLSMEWKAMKEEERSETVARARRQIERGSARHRKLDSLAFVSTVLEERKLQLQHKDEVQKRDREAQAAHDALEAHRLFKEDERNAKRLESERTHQMQDALYQRELAAASRESEAKKRAASSKNYREQLKRIEEGIVAQKRKLASAKAHQIEEYRTALLECMRQKRELVSAEAAFSRQRSAKNLEVRKQQERINNLRSHVKASADRRRQATIDATAAKQQELSLAQKQIRDHFLQKLETYESSSPSGALDQVVRAKQIHERNDASLAEISAYQAQRTKSLCTAKEVKAAESRAERRMLELRATTFMEGERRKKASAGRKARAVGAIRENQIFEQRTIAAQVKRAEEELESRIQKEYEEADRAVEDYAKELVATCSTPGNPLHIPNVLVGQQPADRWASKRLDTFRRLGESVKDRNGLVHRKVPDGKAIGKEENGKAHIANGEKAAAGKSGIDPVKVRQYEEGKLVHLAGWNFRSVTLLAMRDQSWVFDTPRWFTEWPNMECDYMMKLMYQMYTAYTIYSWLDIIFSKTARQKDFAQMMVHHSTTFFLCTFSFYFGFHRVGAVIMFIHDVSDPAMEVAKIALYNGYQTVADGLFLNFAVTFIYTRVWLYPRYVLTTVWLYGPRTFPDGSPAEWLFYIVCAALLALLALHIFWAWLILVMIVKAVREGNVEGDVRDEMEDD